VVLAVDLRMGHCLQVNKFSPKFHFITLLHVFENVVYVMAQGLTMAIWMTCDVPHQNLIAIYYEDGK